MKKSLYFFVLIATFSILLGAQSITVDYPSGGAVTLHQGDPVTITWTINGTMDENVKIRLMKGHGGTEDLVLKITDSTPNDGSFTWTIPATLATGSYLIRVKTVDNDIGADGDFFNVAPKPSGSSGGPKLKPGALAGLAKIKVKAPKYEALWDVGNSYTIRWQTGHRKAFKIELYKYNMSTKLADIATLLLIPGKNYKGKYNYTWKIPANYPHAPGKRTIKVSTHDGKFSGFSKKFNLRTVGLGNQEKTVILNPSSMQRKAHLKSKTYDTADAPSPITPEEKGLGKKANQLRVGYFSLYTTGNAGRWWWWTMVFRSQFQFDLSQYTSDKIVLLKATLHLKKKKTISTLSGNQNHCALGLWQLTAPWTNFYNPSAVHVLNIGQMGGAWNLNVTPRVLEWVKNSVPNHGFLITGINESPPKASEKCVSYFTASLELSYIEK